MAVPGIENTPQPLAPGWSFLHAVASSSAQKRKAAQDLRCPVRNCKQACSDEKELDEHIMTMEEPKKPVGGAFGMFLNEKRAGLQAEIEKRGIGGKDKFTAVTKLASERFKQLGAKSKGGFETRYASMKAKYEKDMEAFIANGGEKKSGKRKNRGNASENKRAKKDPNAPKKPVGGAYSCFLAENRETFKAEVTKQGVAGKDIFPAVTSLAGERWKAMSDKNKKDYEDEHAEKKKAYEEAMKSYVPPAAKADAEEDDESDKDDESEETDESD